MPEIEMRYVFIKYFLLTKIQVALKNIFEFFFVPPLMASFTTFGHLFSYN